MRARFDRNFDEQLIAAEHTIIGAAGRPCDTHEQPRPRVVDTKARAQGTNHTTAAYPPKVSNLSEAATMSTDAASDRACD